MREKKNHLYVDSNIKKRCHLLWMASQIADKDIQYNKRDYNKTPIVLLLSSYLQRK